MLGTPREPGFILDYLTSVKSAIKHTCHGRWNLSAFIWPKVVCHTLWTSIMWWNEYTHILLHPLCLKFNALCLFRLSKLANMIKLQYENIHTQKIQNDFIDQHLTRRHISMPVQEQRFVWSWWQVLTVYCQCYCQNCKKQVFTQGQPPSTGVLKYYNQLKCICS